MMLPGCRGGSEPTTLEARAIMSEVEKLPAEEELKARVRSLNAAWLQGKLDDLRQHFHPEIVMAAHGGTAHIKGREACIKSFEDFLRRAQVHDFRESETRADHLGRPVTRRVRGRAQAVTGSLRISGSSSAAPELAGEGLLRQ